MIRPTLAVLVLLFLLGLLLPYAVPKVFNPANSGDAAGAALLKPTTAEGAADHTYTLRARVDALPSVKRPFLDLHHERLPEFRNEKGEVIGMNEMVMGFPYLAPGVSIEGLAPGDPVEFTMEMRFPPKTPRYLITRLTELPAGTPLNLGTLEDVDD